MPSGGARPRSGPAPDPNALRRDRPSDAAGWTVLPSEGRAGDPPAWPLPEQSDREADVWSWLWRKPQAVMWERHGLTDQVALYCRRWCESEVSGSSVGLGTLVRQMADALGLTMPGMLSMRWRIATDETAAKRAEAAPAPRRTTSRDRLKVVNGDGD
jgi:hypothetical protein